MANYKDVFQLAQDKGYTNEFSFAAFASEWEIYFELCSIQKWLRDQHKIHVSVFAMYAEEDSWKTCWGWNVLEMEWGEDKEHHIGASISTMERSLGYEQALLAGISEALKLIPNIAAQA